MIEVLFGESEAASMKAAKSMVFHINTDDPTAVFCAGKKKIPLKGHARWIEGTSNEVICLGFMLDVGDIELEISDEYRKNLIYSLLYQEQWGKDSAMSSELAAAGDIYQKELKRLKGFIDSGEDIRVWYSKSPYSICGLYFICNWMRQYNNEMYSVQLPEYITEQNRIISYQSWGDVAAAEIAFYLRYEKHISENEKKMYAQKRIALKKDNSPLRVLLNDQIVGFPRISMMF